MQKGGCQCGAIRYESEGRPIALYICHCRECQKQSASTFGISLDVNALTFVLLKENRNIRFALLIAAENLNALFALLVVHDFGMNTNLVLTQKPFQLKEVRLINHSICLNAIHVSVSRELPGILIPGDAKQLPEDE